MHSRKRSYIEFLSRGKPNFIMNTSLIQNFKADFDDMCIISKPIFIIIALKI
jgi:hypothetical protein